VSANTGYGTIVADPPWRYNATGTAAGGMKVRTAEAHYDTMSQEEIAAIDVASMAADDAHLYMWVTNPVLTEQRLRGGPNAIAIMRAWGFEPKTMLTWIKGENGGGMGFYFRGDTEHVLFGVRGNAPIPPSVRRSNVFRGAKGAHSAKPDSFLDIVEQVSPGPYLELFSRRARFGWDTWGNQSLMGGVA
jgi:N6-adenosine-specific RNA methylase IME4